MPINSPGRSQDWALQSQFWRHGSAAPAPGRMSVNRESGTAPWLSQVCRSDAGKATPCGRDSRDALAGLKRHGVDARSKPMTDRGREVATCTNAAELDVGSEMIHQSWAVPYWRYGGARYSKAYDEVLSAHVGMHAGTFIDPERWRRGESAGIHAPPDAIYLARL